MVTEVPTRCAHPWRGCWTFSSWVGAPSFRAEYGNLMVRLVDSRRAGVPNAPFVEMNAT